MQILLLDIEKREWITPLDTSLMNLLKIWDFIFFRFTFKDIDCGFKLFSREAIEKIHH